MVKDVDK